MPAPSPFEEQKLIYRNISNQDLSTVLNQLLGLAEFLKVKPVVADGTDQAFYSNQIMWQSILNRKCHIGQTVKLVDFNLIEWVPLSPGLFYTHKASEARREAQSFVNPTFMEFTPEGKSSMINGGFGSLRLSSKLINNVNYEVLGATSTGLSHQGIPVFIPQDLYNRYIDQIKYNKSALVSIIGKFGLIPDNNIVNVRYINGIPKFCLFVEELIDEDDQDTSSFYHDIYVTVAMAFHENRDMPKIGSNFSWTYTTFEPDPRDQNLQIATEWLCKYPSRYRYQRVKVLNDFDEFVNWFHDPDLTIKSIIENKGINTDLIQKLIAEGKISIQGNVVIGNGNISIENSNNVNLDLTNGAF